MYLTINSIPASTWNVLSENSSLTNPHKNISTRPLQYPSFRSISNSTLSRISELTPLSVERIYQAKSVWCGAAHLRLRVVREVLIFSASQRAAPPSSPIPLSAEIHQNWNNWMGAAHPEVKSSEGGVDLQCITKGCYSWSNSIILRDTSEWDQLDWCSTSRGKE